MRFVRCLLLAVLLAASPALDGDRSNALATSATPIAAGARVELSSYAIAASLSDGDAIAGKERIHFINTTGAALNDIAFRLYPNAAYYSEGSLTVSSVTVDGGAVTPRYLVDDTVMVVPLAAPLPPEQTADLAIAFTTVVPLDSTGSYSIFTRHSNTGDWIVSDWYPIVAGRDARGWRFDPPSAGGDPTFSDAARYSVEIKAPSAMTLVASGSEARTSTSGTTSTWTIPSTPLREFTFLASTTMQRFERTVGDVQLSAYLHPGQDDEALANRILDAAAASLASDDRLFSGYPYKQLDLADVPLPGALGVSWTGMVFLNGGSLFAGALANPAPLQFTIAHEVSHQWWGALVGSNTNDHAFLAEGMANCSAVLTILASQGSDAAAAMLDKQIVQPYLRALNKVGDGTVDRPSEASASGPSLAVLIYGKAALGLLALRETIGAAAFSAALHVYVRDFAFKISGPGDLFAEFQAVSDRDLTPLWHFWFESAAATSKDIVAAAAAIDLSNSQ